MGTSVAPTIAEVSVCCYTLVRFALDTTWVDTTWVATRKHHMIANIYTPVPSSVVLEKSCSEYTSVNVITIRPPPQIILLGVVQCHVVFTVTGVVMISLCWGTYHNTSFRQ